MAVVNAIPRTIIRGGMFWMHEPIRVTVVWLHEYKTTIGICAYNISLFSYKTNCLCIPSNDTKVFWLCGHCVRWTLAKMLKIYYFYKFYLGQKTSTYNGDTDVEISF